MQQKGSMFEVFFDHRFQNVKLQLATLHVACCLMRFIFNNAIASPISITNIHHVNKDVDLCL
jgi:hypothetical protein